MGEEQVYILSASNDNQAKRLRLKLLGQIVMGGLLWSYDIDTNVRTRRLPDGKNFETVVSDYQIIVKLRDL